jgi:hypothetical protein
LYFSPNCRFQDLDFGNPDVIGEAFRDRVEGFYLEPARMLVEARHVFAAGVLLCTAIEFIAHTDVTSEPEAWLVANVPGFEDPSLTKQFWEKFRHGLAHKGRVKEFGQFSIDYPYVISEPFPGVVSVNPELATRRNRSV